MQPNQQRISHAYHFLSEMIIVFLLAWPFLYHRFDFVPYGSYLLVSIGSCLLFTYLAFHNKNVMLNWLFLPVLFALFAVLQYPLIFAGIFSVLFVMCYINIYKQDSIKRESLYLLIGLLITAVLINIMNDWSFFIYLLLLILMVFIGYTSSHLAAINGRERKQFDYRLIGYFIAALTGGAAVFFLFANPLRKGAGMLWSGLTGFFTGTLTALGDLIGYFFPAERQGWPEQNVDDLPGPEDDKIILSDPKINIIEVLTPFIIIGFISLMLGVIIIYIYLIKIRKKTKVEANDIMERATYTMNFSNYDGEQKNSGNWFRKFQKPEHPIRKLVYQFERKAAKNKKGRMPSETVGEWLKRLGMKGNLDVYQKVRYGGSVAVTEEEKESLKAQLKNLEKMLEN